MPSIKTWITFQRSLAEVARINNPMTMPRMGSAMFHPKVIMSRPDMTTAAEPIKSPNTWTKAPSTFRLSPAERWSTQATVRFTMRPPAPTAKVTTPCTSGMSPKRRDASKKIHATISHRLRAFKRAARISVRWNPKVRWMEAGRPAIHMANRAKPMAAESVSR